MVYWNHIKWNSYNYKNILLNYVNYVNYVCNYETILAKFFWSEHFYYLILALCVIVMVNLSYFGVICIVQCLSLKAEIILPCNRGLTFSLQKILSKGAVSQHLVHFVNIAKYLC